MVFSPFSAVRAEDFLPLLNDETLRKHLIPHPLFDVAGVRDWMAYKLGIDARPGCRVRAIFLDGTLAGWCGIQPDDEGVELAIVLAKAGWGSGVAIFNEMMGWARAWPSDDPLSLAGYPPALSIPRQTGHLGEENAPGRTPFHHLLP
jgi:hypothetical protein